MPAPETTPPQNPPAPGRRGHFIASRHIPGNPPVWRRLWFWLFVFILSLLAAPFAQVAWHIAGPDEAAPAKTARPDYAATSKTPGEAAESLADFAHDLSIARYENHFIATLPANLRARPDIVSGDAYDAALTPAFLNAFQSAFDKRAAGFDQAVKREGKPPFRLPDLAATDGFLRAKAANARANNDSGALAEASSGRLALCTALEACADTPEAMDAALLHTRTVCSEIRGDAASLAKSGDALRPLLRRLAEAASPTSQKIATSQAGAFDAALDTSPDAELLVMRDKTSAPAGETAFIRIARFGRKPDAYRRRVSELLGRFGKALAKPTFREAHTALPQPGEIQEIRLGSMFLRDEALARLGDGAAVKYFFPEEQKPDSGLLTFALRFTAFAESGDIYGETLLLHRRAELLGLLARRDRTRFESAATAYALALRYRRDQNNGVWPKDTEGLFDGLLDTYPLDPFSDEPVLYSKRKLVLHSPGADGIDRGGLDDPEFASENAQLWEPTVPLETDPPLNPAAFGLKASDLDKPVLRTSDANQK